MVISTRVRPDSRGTIFTLRDYLNTCFYYRKIVLAVFLAVAALGCLAAWFMPMPYRAQSTLLVLYAGYYDQSSNVQGTPLVPAVGQLVSVEAHILNSPELRRKVVSAQLGPNASPEEINQRLQQFDGRFRIEQNDLANTIKLSYLDKNPQQAVDALDSLLDEYFKQRATIFTSGRAEMVTSLRDDARERLAKATNALIEFQKKHDVVNINEQIARAVALESLLVQRKMENDAALAQDRKGLAALIEATRDVKPDIHLFTDNAETMRAQAEMRIALTELEARRAELASRYLDTSPFVQQLDKQIKDMRANLARQKATEGTATRRGHNTYYDTVQDKLASLSTLIAGEEAREKELSEQVEIMRARMTSLIAVSNQLRQMQIHLDVLADTYRDRSRQVELAVSQQEQAKEANSTNVRVIEAPELPSDRTISFGMLVAASIVVALLLAAMVGLLLSMLRETFLSPEQIERSLQLRVLSAPITPRNRSQLSRAVADSALNRRTVHQAYGQLAARVQASPGRDDTTCRVAMLLAYGKNEGLQHVVQGLAVELGTRSAKPVLILDMGSAQGEWAYGQPDDQGVIAWKDVESNGHWQGSALDAASDDVLNTLDFYRIDKHNIMVARLKSGSAELPRYQIAGLLDALRSVYDYVLVEAPPVAQSIVGVENASQVDAVVLVVRAESTRKPVAQMLKNQVEEADGNIIGVAMTSRHVYIPNAVYQTLTNRSPSLKTS